MSFINVIWCTSTHLNIEQHPYKARIDVAPLVTASQTPVGGEWDGERRCELSSKCHRQPRTQQNHGHGHSISLSHSLGDVTDVTQQRALALHHLSSLNPVPHNDIIRHLSICAYDTFMKGWGTRWQGGLCGWPNFKHRHSCTYRYSFRSHALLLLFTRESGKRGTTWEYVATLKSLGNLEILYLYWNFIVCLSHYITLHWCCPYL